MPRLEADPLLKRADAAFAEQSRWTGLWDLAYKYTFPHKDILSQTPGARRGVQVYDSTAGDAALRLANRLQTDIFPPYQEWAILDAGKNVPDGLRDQVRKVLQDNQGKLFELFDNSNFASALNECAQELVMGTGTLLFQEGTPSQPFKFASVQINMVAIDEGPFDTVDGVFVKYKLPHRLIKATFPYADKIPDALQAKALDPATQDQPCEIVHCVYHDFDAGQVCHDLLWRDGKLSLLSRPMVEETSPWLVFRWSKSAGERYGRGPGVNMLPTILTTNKVMEFTLKGAAYRITPMTTVANDGTNPNIFQFVPGAMNPVERNDNDRPSIKPFDFGGDPNLSELILADLRAMIKRGFHDQSLPPDTGPVRSYGEIVMRMKELQSDIGGVFSRLQGELVTPLVVRGLSIMARRKMIEFPLRVDGTTIKVVPKSPLAMLKNLSSVETIVQWLQICQGLGPEALMLGAKIEDIPSIIGNLLGVPQEAMRTVDERAKLQTDIAQIVVNQQAAARPQQPTPTGGRPQLVAAQ